MAAGAGAEAAEMDAGAVTAAATGVAATIGGAVTGLSAPTDPVGTATPGLAALALPEGDGAEVVAMPSLLRSLMFLLSSVTRVAVSWAARSLAILSSADLPWTAPLDNVSLSGVGATAFFSSTWAVTLPETSRSGAPTPVAGRLRAGHRRRRGDGGIR